MGLYTLRATIVFDPCPQNGPFNEDLRRRPALTISGTLPCPSQSGL